jgi:hypothetical protein
MPSLKDGQGSNCSVLPSPEKFPVTPSDMSQDSTDRGDRIKTPKGKSPIHEKIPTSAEQRTRRRERAQSRSYEEMNAGLNKYYTDGLNPMLHFKSVQKGMPNPKTSGTTPSVESPSPERLVREWRRANASNDSSPKVPLRKVSKTTRLNRELADMQVNAPELFYESREMPLDFFQAQGSASVQINSNGEQSDEWETTADEEKEETSDNESSSSEEEL